MLFRSAGWADAGLRQNTDSMYGSTDRPLMQHSVGLSLIWRSPIGPLRFEWGIPLDRQTRPDGATEDPLVFEFTIGNPF